MDFNQGSGNLESLLYNRQYPAALLRHSSPQPILTYRIFSIKRPWHLFQTWHGGPGICLNQQFIWARDFLRKGYSSFFLAAVYVALKL